MDTEMILFPICTRRILLSLPAGALPCTRRDVGTSLSSSSLRPSGRALLCQTPTPRPPPSPPACASPRRQPCARVTRQTPPPPPAASAPADILCRPTPAARSVHNTTPTAPRPLTAPPCANSRRPQTRSCPSNCSLAQPCRRQRVCPVAVAELAGVVVAARPDATPAHSPPSCDTSRRPRARRASPQTPRHLGAHQQQPVLRIAMAMSPAWRSCRGQPARPS